MGGWVCRGCQQFHCHQKLPRIQASDWLAPQEANINNNNSLLAPIRGLLFGGKLDERNYHHRTSNHAQLVQRKLRMVLYSKASSVRAGQMTWLQRHLMCHLLCYIHVNACIIQISVNFLAGGSGGRILCGKLQSLLWSNRMQETEWRRQQMQEGSQLRRVRRSTWQVEKLNPWH